MAKTIKSLILTDSAGKARALKRIAGSSYQVLSTDGLLKDLPKSRIGIGEGYSPDYITIRGKGDLLKELKRETLKAGKIFLAMNPDSAGEFLALQCCQLFGVNEESHCRMYFDELTKNAVKNSIAEAQVIDTKKVDAFQAKQIIDKFVSHKVGEYLSCKIYRGVKVGRFRALLLNLIDSGKFPSELEFNGKLTAGKLQELASLKLGFSATKTRLMAEQLYEGINFDKGGYGGLIKYPYGGITLAAEKREPESVREFLTDSQFKLYELIYSAAGISEKVALDGKCTDLALMAALDDLGIAWEKFYSIGMNSLLKRQYVKAGENGYEVTALGKRVLEALAGFFDEDFSADTYNKITAQVAEIAAGRAEKISVIESYCEKFDANFARAMETLGEDAKPQDEPVIETDEICEKCGHKMVIKRGRYGLFMACSNYPECKNVKAHVKYLEQKCPKCGGRITKREFRGGRNLYGCEFCDFRTWDDPLENPCKECGATMFRHKFKERTPMVYCGNEKCPTRAGHPINKILEEAARRRETRKAE